MTRKWSLLLFIAILVLPMIHGCTKDSEPEKVEMNGSYTQDTSAPPNKKNAGTSEAQGAL